MVPSACTANRWLFALLAVLGATTLASAQVVEEYPAPSISPPREIARIAAPLEMACGPNVLIGSSAVCFMFSAGNRLFHLVVMPYNVYASNITIANPASSTSGTVLQDRLLAQRWFRGHEYNSPATSSVRVVIEDGILLSGSIVTESDGIFMIERPDDANEHTRAVLHHAFPSHDARESRRKRRAPGPQVSTRFTRCEVFLDADKTFYDQYGGDGTEEDRISRTALKMLDLFYHVDSLYAAQPELQNMIGFDVVGLKVHNTLTRFSDSITSASSAGLDVLEDYGKFLGRGTVARGSGELTFADVCLNHLFVHENLNGVLGVAIQAPESTNVLGGICEDRTGAGRSAANIGLTTTRGANGAIVPFFQSVLSSTHEFGHSLGASHDCVLSACASLSGSQCVPTEAQGGPYIMFPLVRADEHENAHIFSPCSVDEIANIIEKKGNCLKLPATCGGSTGIECTPAGTCQYEAVELGPCTAPCGGGIQSVSYACMCPGGIIDETRCSGDPPLASNACGSDACTVAEGSSDAVAAVLIFGSVLQSSVVAHIIRDGANLPITVLETQAVEINGQDGFRTFVRSCRQFGASGCISGDQLFEALNLATAEMSMAYGSEVRPQTSADSVAIKEDEPSIAISLLIGIAAGCAIIIVAIFARRYYKKHKKQQGNQAPSVSSGNRAVYVAGPQGPRATSKPGAGRSGRTSSKQTSFQSGASSGQANTGDSSGNLTLLRGSAFGKPSPLRADAALGPVGSADGPGDTETDVDFEMFPASTAPSVPIRQLSLSGKPRMHGDKLPSSMQQRLASASSLPPPMPAAPVEFEAGYFVEARINFAGAASGQLPLQRGDIVRVLETETSTPGWMRGQCNGRTGIFPERFVDLTPLELGGTDNADGASTLGDASFMLYERHTSQL
eukprot:m.130873 g.130873  ORF g.130873 m.130873 type:complete len:904 (+) comp9797_c0_seq1:112-2823(+)